MLLNFVKNNIQLVSIIVFLLLFIILVITKPALIFDKNGVPRQFGLGYKNKTICPIWLIILIFGILSYFLVLYFINFHKFVF